MSDVLDAYVAFFETLRRDTLDGLDALVTADVRFRDPFNDVVGVPAMKKALDAAFDHGTPKFEVTDRARGTKGAYLLWRFTNGAGFEIEGMSEIRFAPDGRVAAHLDHWDSGTQFYLRLPVIGRIVALVRNRLRVRA